MRRRRWWHRLRKRQLRIELLVHLEFLQSGDWVQLELFRMYQWCYHLQFLRSLLPSQPVCSCSNWLQYLQSRDLLLLG